ncbi:MAG: glycosyltransferase family 4 protein [Planctomycetes bacterium]|nr:glycosyltransferase family 4 protein [Planctomycetota bacterium]
MRIGFDITQAAKSRGRGIARYIRDLLPELERVSQRAPDSGAVLDLNPTLYFRGSRWLNRGLVRDLMPSAPRRPLWWGPSAKLDLFHSFGNHLPAQSAVPLSFTAMDFRLADMTPNYDLLGSRLGQNISRADGVICISQYTAQRLRHYFPDFPEERVAVTPLGVDHRRFCPQDGASVAAVRAKHGLARPYALQIGSWFPHKNLELSIRAFAASQARAEGCELVFVGGGATADFLNSLKKLATSLGLTGIHWLGHISDDELAPILAGARVFLHPSRYEGFGLPILESMATGTPGVISNSTCLTEVAGELWQSFDVDDEIGFASGLDHLFFDDSAHQIASETGLAHASAFTWRQTADLTASFFKQFF